MALKIRIDPDAADRALVVELDSRNFFRSSQIPLNGARSLSTYWLRFDDLPAGEYEVRVALERSGAEPLTAESSFRVVGTPVIVKTRGVSALRSRPLTVH